MDASRKPIINHTGIVRLPFPAEIAIETHAHCNFACVVCPYPKLERSKGRMAPDLFHKIIDEVAHESPSTRLWLAIMGEPLMDKRLVSFLHYAQDHGARRIHLNTNGTLLEGERAREILESGSVESVYIAIDASKEQTFNVVRPGGDFDRIRKNVENLLKMKAQQQSPTPEIVVQFISMEENEGEMGEFSDYWSSKGAVVKLRLRQGWGTEIDAPDLHQLNLERFPCPWLIRTMNVHWTGAVTQCDPDYEEKFPAGDLNTQSIKEVWDGELAARRERHWAGDYSHPLCHHCMDWAAGRAEFQYPSEESRTNAPRWSLGEKK